MAKNSAAKKQVAKGKNSQTSVQSNAGVGIPQPYTKAKTQGKKGK